MVVLKRGGLARVLEPLAHIAADDQQLRKVGELAGTSVYRLRYGNDKAMLFLSKGDRLLLLSNPRMLFDDGGESDDSPLNAPASEDTEALLDGDELFPERFGLPGRGELRQRITLNASVLAMGYQRFIPSFAGVRFEKGEQGWSSYLALNEVERQPPLDFAPVWQAMPMGASACVALPVTPGLYGVMLERLGAEQKMAQAFSEHLSGAAGLCWYASSRLHSPLLVGQLSAPASAELDDELGKLFGRVIGAKEAKVEGGSFPVEDRVDGQTRRWTRQVSSNFGAYPASQADNPDSISGRAFFRIGMARHGRTLLFSSTTSCSARPGHPRQTLSAARRGVAEGCAGTGLPGAAAALRTAATGNPRQPAAGHGAGIPQCRRHLPDAAPENPRRQGQLRPRAACRKPGQRTVAMAAAGMAVAVRRLTAFGLALLLLASGVARGEPAVTLDPQQSQVFRAWFVRIAQNSCAKGRVRAGTSRTAPAWCASPPTRR